MEDPRYTRRRARDVGLDAVNRWTRRAVAGGIVLCGALGIGLAHLIPGQVSATHEPPSPSTTSEPTTPDPTTRTSDDSDDDSDDSSPPSVLKPPATKPRPSHSTSHATSGGS
jgi:hypothetical protein